MRLLIVQCGEIVSETPGLVPAWKRYRSSLHLVAYKYMRKHNDVDLYFLSLRKGLLHYTEGVLPYSVPRKQHRAEALALATDSKEQVRDGFNAIDDTYDEICLCFGGAFIEAFSLVEIPGIAVYYIRGVRIMKMMNLLKEWLYKSPGVRRPLSEFG